MRRPPTFRNPAVTAIARRFKARVPEPPLLHWKLARDRATGLHYRLLWYKHPFTRKNAVFGGVEFTPLTAGGKHAALKRLVK